MSLTHHWLLSVTFPTQLFFHHSFIPTQLFFRHNSMKKMKSRREKEKNGPRPHLYLESSSAIQTATLVKERQERKTRWRCEYSPRSTAAERET
ncbi:hypothetical protein Ahy_A04g020742 isoform C [Arachis hypogaea]|uniref:Uncharacterized protein n=1 Tax=Arachis hypogaea TaxID=3818 RepID=A0A445DIH8_ARAHY|nr:hypothetical protein Ahy_A04g020742 isoform C [Arachis hypogaea]